MAETQRTDDAAGKLLGGAVRTAFLRDAQAWTGLQRELLSGVEALWAEYAQRQNEAMAASARTFSALLDGCPFVEVAQLQRDWLASAARATVESVDRTREAASSAGRKIAAANESLAQTVASEAAE
jgi:hypothetical protein